jgi:hypothetical protein
MQLESEISLSNRTDDADTIKEIVSTMAVLKKYHITEIPSEVFSRILASKPRGITVTGFIYTSPSDPTAADQFSVVDISGTASSRIVLSQFNDVLKKDKIFKTVFIPISSFAKEKNITYTLKLTISNQPKDWNYVPVDISGTTSQSASTVNPQITQ